MIVVVKTNTNNCKIYHYEKHPAQLTLFKEISHPENKLHSRDLASDGPGHYQSGVSARGAYTPQTEPKEVEIDNFAREIARELNAERNQHGYAKLVIIATPHMLGLLTQHLDKHVKDLISNSINKDLQNLSEHELLTFLQTHTQYPDK